MSFFFFLFRAKRTELTLTKTPIQSPTAKGNNKEATKDRTKTKKINRKKKRKYWKNYEPEPKIILAKEQAVARKGAKWEGGWTTQSLDLFPLEAPRAIYLVCSGIRLSCDPFEATSAHRSSKTHNKRASAYFLSKEPSVNNEDTLPMSMPLALSPSIVLLSILDLRQ